MDYLYYERDISNRLFRLGVETNSQERWTAEEGRWVSVAPGLTDRLMDGDPFTDELTKAQAEAKYPAAFEGDEPWVLTTALMNRIQAAIQTNVPFETFLERADVPTARVPEVQEFWSALSVEMSRPLPPGHFWDVSGEWS